MLVTKQYGMKHLNPDITEVTCFNSALLFKLDLPVCNYLWTQRRSWWELAMQNSSVWHYCNHSFVNNIICPAGKRGPICHRVGRSCGQKLGPVISKSTFGGSPLNFGDSIHVVESDDFQSMGRDSSVGHGRAAFLQLKIHWTQSNTSATPEHFQCSQYNRSHSTDHRSTPTWAAHCWCLFFPLSTAPWTLNR